MTSDTPHVREWHFPFGLVALLGVATLSLSCSTSNQDADAEAWKKQEEEARLVAPKAAEMSEWRQEWLPRLLAEFDSNDQRDWHNARRQLLENEHTPARRTNRDGEVVDTHIRAMLQQDDWDSAANRAKLVEEGLIYEHLSRFSSKDRSEWRAARRTLVALGEEGAERAALELMLRLGWTPDDDRPRSEDDLALWAIEELREIGADAVPVLVHGTYMRSMIEGMEGNRYFENVYYALAEIGAPSIEPLALDLRNSRKFPNDDTRFQRIRRQLRTLESIFKNLRDSNHPAHVADLSEVERERRVAIEFIDETLKEYRPSNDLRLFQIRQYGILALRRIGSEAACMPLIELWEQAAREQDRDIIDACRDALTSITGRRIDTLEDWKRFVVTLD